MNRLITCGFDQRWRHALAAMAVHAALVRGRQDSPDPTSIGILDCACGTGDVAFALAGEIQDARLSGAVTGIDFNPEMIRIARRKASVLDAQWEGQVSLAFEEADAMALPFLDASFDACTIAFGLRNLPDMRRAVHELLRVVRPGGALCILETGQPPPGIWRFFARVYSSTVMPLLGLLVSGNWRAYRYLYTTSWRFPSGTGLAALIEADPLAGEVDWRPLSGGVAYLYRIMRRPTD